MAYKILTIISNWYFFSKVKVLCITHPYATKILIKNIKIK